jgi:hypothetical protein
MEPIDAKAPDKPKYRFPRKPKFYQPPDRGPIAFGEPVVLNRDRDWKKKIDSWLDRREGERRKERDQWGRDKRHCKCPHRPDRMPYPWLDATSNFGPQISALNVDEAGSVTFTVWNDGDYPAWNCYVEVYEGPGGYTSPLSAYQLRGRRILTLHPGERREVQLPWIRRQRTGRIVGIVFDPLLDPIDFAVVEQLNRHITSVHYTELD